MRDLLRGPTSGKPGAAGAGAGAGAADDGSGALAIHQDVDGNPEVPGLTRMPVAEASGIDALLAQAERRRAVASTNMNDRSSRSHLVFTLHLRGVHADKGIAVSGALNLVDLAGSERLARSGAEGDRKREAAAINKSLSCLADVFSALSKRAPHVPFRNSKLTHLLQRCFKGDGKTLMIVNLSPTLESAFESLCSLRFASQVSQVELGKPVKRVVEALTNGTGTSAGGSGAGSSLVGSSSSSSSAAAAAGGAGAAARVASDGNGDGLDCIDDDGDGDAYACAGSGCGPGSGLVDEDGGDGNEGGADTYTYEGAAAGLSSSSCSGFDAAADACGDYSGAAPSAVASNFMRRAAQPPAPPSASVSASAAAGAGAAGSGVGAKRTAAALASAAGAVGAGAASAPGAKRPATSANVAALSGAGMAAASSRRLPTGVASSSSSAAAAGAGASSRALLSSSSSGAAAGKLMRR